MTRPPWSIPGLLGLLLLAGCGEKEFEPPDREEQVAEASAEYTATAFDTLTWASDSVRALEGNATYAAFCRRCHGTLGMGETELAEERSLEVPSLVEPDWPLAESLDSVRHRVWAGHPGGMPTFGVARLSPRQIDGAAFYILERLRPEVLEPPEGATSPSGLGR